MRLWIHHTLVSAEASTDDSVVGRVTRNYAHPSEYPPTCYYRRNARSPWQNAHLSRVPGWKGWRARKSCSVHYSLIVSAHSLFSLFSANETKTSDSCSGLWSLRPCISLTTDFPIVINDSCEIKQLDSRNRITSRRQPLITKNRLIVRSLKKFQGSYDVLWFQSYTLTWRQYFTLINNSFQHVHYTYLAKMKVF